MNGRGQDDIEHMRKVVGFVWRCADQHLRRLTGYCRYVKRHLAQEEHLKDEKSPEELESAKSTIRSVNHTEHVDVTAF